MLGSSTDNVLQNVAQSLYLQSAPESHLFQAVYVKGQITLSDKVIDITALSDTGALHYSYVAQRIIEANKPSFLPYLSPHSGRVRLADGKTVVATSEKATLPVIFFGKDGQQHFGNVECVVFPDMGSNEMILGLPDIIKSFSRLHMGLIQDAVDNMVSNPEQVNSIGDLRPPDDTPPLLDPPWSQAIPNNNEAIEDTETPLPCSFPDALYFMEKSHDEAVAEFINQIPDHIHPDFATQTDIVKFLKEVAVKVFVPQSWTGINGLEPFELEWTDGLPESIKPKARPVNPKLFENAKREFERLCTYFYRPSTSPIASCLVIAPKATFPFIRFCGDYVLINKYIIMGHFPMPNVLHVLEKISMFAVFLDIDLANAFHQIRLGPITSARLSVQTPWGQVEPLMMPEGIKPAPGKLNIVVLDIFGDFSDWIICIHDNILVLAHDYADAFDKFKIVVQRCLDRNVVLKFSKTWLGFPEVKFFGYVCTRHSYRLSDDRKETLLSIPFPTTLKQMQSFLGAALFFKNFIPHFSNLTAPLHDMVHKTFNWNDKSTWTVDYRNVFDVLKSHLLGANALYFPDYNLDWILRTDASLHGIGAVLLQVFIAPNGAHILQPISYVSKKFSEQARKWSTIEQEAYAIYYAVNHFAYYLRCKHFVLETDHNNLLWMEASQVPKIVRWRVLLQSFSFSLRHIAGKDNTVADWLSRIHEYCESFAVAAAMNSLFDGRDEALYPSTIKDVNSLLTTIHSGRSLHPGVRRTWITLNETYPGHKIPYKVVEDFCMTCPICQKDRLARDESIKEVVRHLKAPTPRSIIGVDTLTVTPADSRGNTVILVVINLFTKLVGLYPAPKHDAINTATAIFQYFCTYGLVDAIVSDPGTEFTNEVIQHLTRWLGVRHSFSLVDRHQSNGTEATNKAILRHLRALVYDERVADQWSSPTVLPLIQYVLNSTHHSESGASAIDLTFGTLDSSYFNIPSLEEKDDSMHSDTHAFIKKLDDTLQYLRKKSQDFQAQLAATRTAETPVELQNTFQPGDLVLYERTSGIRPTKLSPRYIGPYEVIKQYKNDVTCKHVIMGNIEVLHVSRLGLFFGNMDAAKRMAMIDHDQYEVETFLAHRGDVYTRTTMEFEVRFKDGDIKWLPFSDDLFKTIQYEEYCRSKPELQLLLFKAKIATEKIREWNSSPIVDIKPKDEYYVDLRCYGATWYNTLSIPDRDHITYVVLYQYMDYKNKSHTKINARCPIFNEVFTVANDFIKLYGCNKGLAPNGQNIILIDDAFIKQYPCVLPST
jgi:hypothetical protein